MRKDSLQDIWKSSILEAILQPQTAADHSDQWDVLNRAAALLLKEQQSDTTDPAAAHEDLYQNSRRTVAGQE
jgi:hypothetical protein